MMKSLHILTSLLALITLSTLAHAQGAPPVTSPTPTPAAPPPEVVTYKYLLELQERQNAQQLLLQKEIADRAITTASNQMQAVFVTTETVAALIVIASALIGWWVKRQFNVVQQRSKEAESKLAEIRKRSKEIEAELESFRERIEGTTAQIGVKVEELNESFNGVHMQARLADVRGRLRSESVEIQRIAAQEATEIVRDKGGAVAMPVLLESLNPQGGRDPSVVAELLYGLSHRAKEIGGDEKAIALILSVSESPAVNVRRQALETIEKIGLDGHDNLKQRVQSYYEGDDDDELKEWAGRILGTLVVN